MFIPCHHCLRKHAIHVSEVNERGEPEQLWLCKECHQRLREQLSRQAPIVPDSSLAMDRTEKEIADVLQANLLPRSIPQIAGYDFSALYRPAQAVGGDAYDVFKIDDNHLAIFVADVSANGIPGTIVMTETRALLRSEAVRALSPGETLARVNRTLYQDIKRGMFVTVYFAVLNMKRSLLTCVSAGHNPMVFWNQSGKELRLINPNGIALGVDPGPLFERTLKEQCIQLASGDRFTLYTDGVVETTDERNEAFGQNRFYHRAKDLSELGSTEFLEVLMWEVDRHRGNVPQRDDITVVTGRYKGK